MIKTRSKSNEWEGNYFKKQQWNYATQDEEIASGNLGRITI